MRIHQSLLLALVTAASLPAQDTDDWQPDRRNIRIPMRDGKDLLADAYLPARKGRYPTILIQTPYNKKFLGAPISQALQKADAGEAGRGAVSDVRALLDRKHYVYVVVDWRGFYANKAALRGTNKRTWRRGHDGYDAVEWIAKQPWSDGKVGTWGGSALGKQQFNTALEHPPHLVCCAPLIAAMGISYDQYFERGVPLEAHLKILDLLGYDMRTRVRKNPRPDTLLWRIVARTTYRPQAIEVPCLMITGWWDNYPDAVVRTFEDIVARGGAKARAHSKLLIGPWDHVGIGLTQQGDLRFPKAHRESAKAAKAFFDFHLRGVKNGHEKTPRVRYFDSGARRWHSADSVTRRPRSERVFRGDAEGRLAAQAETEGDRAYTYDPKRPSPTLGGANLPPLRHGPKRQDALLEREDVLVYRTGPLTEPLTLDGKLRVAFTFSADRVDCDFCLRLCEVDAKGRAILLGDTAARAKFRDGKLQLLEPGTPARIELAFPQHCHTFAKGTELMLLVTSGNSPRYERNPHTGDDLWNRRKAVPVKVTIGHGNATPFVVRVPHPK